MTVLRWASGQHLDFTVEAGPIVVARPGSGTPVTSRGHLRLPLAVRRRSRIAAGDRVLVVPDHDRGEALVVPVAVLDDIVGAYRGSRAERRPDDDRRQ